MRLPGSATPDAYAARVLLDVPIHRFLGVELLDPASPDAGIRFTVGEAAVNNVGVLHGGIVTALLDMAGLLAVLPTFAPDEQALTHEISASLIRGVDVGSTVEIRGGVLRRGRRVAFLRAEASVEGALVAAAGPKSVLR